jgi:hypothetical protein
MVLLPLVSIRIWYEENMWLTLSFPAYCGHRGFAAIRSPPGLIGTTCAKSIQVDRPIQEIMIGGNVGVDDLVEKT